MTKTILLTGATGFVGQGLVHEMLERGWNVIATTSKPIESLDNKNLHPNVTWLQANLGDSETHTKEFWSNIIKTHYINGIVSNAGIIEEDPSKNASYDNVNFKPVPALLEAAKENKIDSFMHISTSAAVSKRADQYGYSRSKKKADDYLCKQMQDADTQSTPKIFLIRPHLIYSPEKGWGHDMMFDDQAALPLQPYIGTGEQMIQPVLLDDMVKVLNLFEKNNGNEIVDVVGPEPLTHKGLVKFLREDVRHEVFRPVRIPYIFAAALVNNFRLGVASPFAIEVLRDQEDNAVPLFDPSRFEEIIERKPRTIVDAYLHSDHILLKNPPLDKVIRMISNEPWRVARFLQDLITGAATQTQTYLSGKPTPQLTRTESAIALESLAGLSEGGSLQRY